MYRRGRFRYWAIAAGGYHSLAISTPAMLPLVFNLVPPNLQMTAAGFQLQVDGAAGVTPVVIYASTNMADWTPIFTNPPVTGSLPFLDSVGDEPFAAFLSGQTITAKSRLLQGDLTRWSSRFSVFSNKLGLEFQLKFQTGCCWVRQWSEPEPSTRSTA